MYKLLLPIHIGLAKLVQETEDYIKQTAIEAIQPLLSSSVSTVQLSKGLFKESENLTLDTLQNYSDMVY